MIYSPLKSAIHPGNLYYCCFVLR